MPHAKRWLYLVHRWLGVLLCAFFAMWFFSGVVMMYVGYPKLTAAERLAHLPPLHTATVGLEPEQALQAAGPTCRRCAAPRRAPNACWNPPTPWRAQAWRARCRTCGSPWPAAGARCTWWCPPPPPATPRHARAEHLLRL